MAGPTGDPSGVRRSAAADSRIPTMGAAEFGRPGRGMARYLELMLLRLWETKSTRMYSPS